MKSVCLYLNIKELTMNKTILSLILVFTTISLASQIKGKITDANSNSLPYVNVYLKNTLSGTISNDDGFYELNLKKTGTHTIIFQFLGFKTQEKTINITQFPFQLDVTMVSEDVILKEVTVSSKENPANSIIKKVIASKEKNTNKLSKYTADFYSRGLFKVKNAPKKILGRKIGELGGGLDSSRSGIIYLSETVSKISYQKKPKKFKEIILASKVSGENNGIAFNSADDVNFNLYSNQVSIAGAQLFSPVSQYAFSYYEYKLEGTFYDKNNNLINKIKLIPKRENDRVFGGYIYIVENNWTIYGTNLTVSGQQINNPGIDLLHIKQDYNYDKKTKTWAIILQTIDFKLDLLGFKINGRFSASYSNYNFKPIYTRKTFTKKVLSFKKDATKKDSVYWNTIRPVQLTLEEKVDYLTKDSIKTVHTSKKYLDSVDSKNNNFKWLSPFLKYDYKNSFKKWQFNYRGPLSNTRFNTVQGFETTIGFKYNKRNNDVGNNWNAGVDFNYGFSEKKLRPLVSFTKNWNRFKRPHLYFQAGKKINQFDYKNPIPTIPNTFLSLFFKENFAKFYDKTFAKINYSQEITTGIRFFSALEYANRKPLFNNTDFSFFHKNKKYITNNPINSKITTAPFKEHSIFSTSLGARINFGSKYVSYPDSKYTIFNRKYPTLNINYKKSFGSNNNNLHFDFVALKLHQNIGVSNLGEFRYMTKTGGFLKEKKLAFIDYYHPLVNRILVTQKNRMESFNIPDYYQLSTNKNFAEIHTEHNFKGFLLNKIPLIKHLNLHTIISAKSYFSSDNKPYSEFGIGLDKIGWGKWRILRLDYIQSYHNGHKEIGYVLGLNFF